MHSLFTIILYQKIIENLRKKTLIFPLGDKKTIGLLHRVFLLHFHVNYLSNKYV